MTRHAGAGADAHAPPEDDRLEVIVPEGWEGASPGPEPRPPLRQRLRVTPKWIGFLGGALVAAALFAGYAGLAISGVRALERVRDQASQLTAEREALSHGLLAKVVSQEDTVVVADATRGLLLEHRTRAIALAGHAARIRAVDPGVRDLRQAVVGALMRDAHDLEHAAEAPVPPAAPTLGRGYPFVDRLLEQERRQWRLDVGEVPEPPDHLRAADTAFVRLSLWTDQRTGARLLVNGGAGLRLLDLDTSTAVPIEFEDGVGAVAVGADFVAVDTGGQVVMVDPREPSNRLALPVGDPGDVVERIVVATAAGDGVWVQERDELESTRRFRREGGGAVESPRGHGELVADLGPTLLWVVPKDPEADRSLPRLASYILSDRLGGDVLARWEARELLVASPAGMAWRVDSERLEVTDPLGRVVAVPARENLFPRSAAFSLDGRRLAVGWGNGLLDIIDVAGEGGGWAVTHSVSTSGPSVLRWTPSGEYVFFATGTGLAWYKPGEAEARRLRLREAGGMLIAAF